MQIIRDLSLVAQVDERACAEKENMLSQFAKDLGVTNMFLSQCLGREPELD